MKVRIKRKNKSSKTAKLYKAQCCKCGGYFATKTPSHKNIKCYKPVCRDLGGFTDTEEEYDLSKLPGWAKTLVLDLTKQRDSAVGVLDMFTEDQERSPFSFEERVFIKEKSGTVYQTRYVKTHKMSVDWGGVTLAITLNPWEHDKKIGLQWEVSNAANNEAIIMTPEAFQCMSLCTTEGRKKTKVK